MNSKVKNIRISAFILMAFLCPVTSPNEVLRPGDPRILEIQVIDPMTNEMILPHTPVREQREPEVRIAACRGEFEPASFVLLSRGVNTSNVMISSSDLVYGEHVIPSANIKVHTVKVWYQENGAWSSHRVKKARRPTLVPELLLHDDDLVVVDRVKQKNFVKLHFPEGPSYVSISDSKLHKSPVIKSIAEFPVQDAPSLLPFELKSGEPRQIWVTVKVPRAATAGDYQGKLTVTSGDKVAKQFPFSVRVLPFDLDEPILTYSIYYRGVLEPNRASISSEYKNETQLRAELQNMMDHGIDNPTVYQKMLPEDRLAYYLEIRRSLGLDKRPLFYLGRTTGMPNDVRGLSVLKADVKKVVEVARHFGVTDVYFYGADEAKGDKLLAQRPAWEAVHEVGGKVFAAGYKGHYDLTGALTDLLVFHGRPDVEEASKVHASGSRIFSYSNPQAGPENPALFRRNFGFLLWQAGFDGAMDYAYQHSMGFIWNDFDHDIYRDPVFAYPTLNGVIDTLAWEGFREAVDDLRYLTTLSNAARRASSKSEQSISWANEVREYLSSLRTRSKLKPDVARAEIIGLLLRYPDGDVY